MPSTSPAALYYFKQDGTLQARVDLNYAGIDFVHGPDPTPRLQGSVRAGHVSRHRQDGYHRGCPLHQDEKDYTYHRHNPDGTLPSPPRAFRLRPPATECGAGRPQWQYGSLRIDQIDWRLVFDYQWTDDIMTYVQAATGYKGGGINPRPFFTTQVLRSILRPSPRTSWV
jgi:iron complex outermembrane receptor protein